VDQALRDAVRPLGQWQLEMAMDGELTPREIQARVRRGENPEQIAAAAGEPLERVERYARPVIGERARIVDLARSTQIDPASLEPGPTLADRADEGLAADEAVDVQWDAARDDDGRWTVEVQYSSAGQLRRAAWWFDPVTRSVVAADGLATSIQEPGGDVLPLARRRTAGPPPTPVEPEPIAESPAAPAPPVSAPRHDTAPLPLPDIEPAAAADDKPKRRKRASVPSWDDIVFGARRDDA
jgi:hypothetical protein